MDKLPDEITLCNLQVVVMPNGEIICNGKTLGWYRDYFLFLTAIKKDGCNNNDRN